jgi:hypothetical protein
MRCTSIKKLTLTLGASCLLFMGTSLAQTGLPIWPMGITGANNDVLIDFAHNTTTKSSQIPNTQTNQVPIGTGVALDGCGNLDLYFLPTTTVYATPYNLANPACFQEVNQLMRIYDKNGNSLTLCDPSWNQVNSAAYPFYMDACAGDRELQVIPRKGLAAGAPLQWFVIYNEPYQLQSTDLNGGSYGYTFKQFPTGYRPSKIKYSLIEYDPTNHPANPLRRIQPDAELLATPWNKPAVLCTYMQGKAVDLPDGNGNYTMYVAYMNQLAYVNSTTWSNVTNIVLHQFTINSNAGTISYVSYAPFQNNKTANQLAQSVNIDGYVIAQSSIEIGHAYGSDDYKIALNLRNDNNYPSLLLFSKSFSAPSKIIQLGNQRVEPSGVPLSAFGSDLENKVGGIEWDPTGQYLYLTSGNGAANANAYLIQLNTADYNSTTKTYGVNFQNQAQSATAGAYAIGDIERGYNNKLYISKTNFASSIWPASPEIFSIDMTLNGAAFQNSSANHDIDFHLPQNYIVPNVVGGAGLCFMPDGIDGYDYSNGAVIANLDPGFSLTATSPNGNSTTFSVSVTCPVLPSCAGFWWNVCETDVNGNAISCMTNPSNWWDPSQVPTCTFPGYTFLQGHYYTITRGVWGCCSPWSTYSKTVYMTTPPLAPPIVISKTIDLIVPMPDNLTLNTAMAPESVNNVSADGGNKFRLYPNPSQGNFQVDYEMNENQSGIIIISDMTGRTLSKHELISSQTSIQLHEEELNNGIYLYSIYVGNQMMKTGKFSILH